jgi:hypothetical protein
MIFQTKVQITRLWCFLTFAEAVYVKIPWLKSKNPDTSNSSYGSIEVRPKVARFKFDPFTDNKVLSTYDKTYIRELLQSGKVEKFDNGKWTYINLGKQVELKLRNA